jgi:hypothetical protein
MTALLMARHFGSRFARPSRHFSQTSHLSMICALPLTLKMPVKSPLSPIACRILTYRILIYRQRSYAKTTLARHNCYHSLMLHRARRTRKHIHPQALLHRRTVLHACNHRNYWVRGYHPSHGRRARMGMRVRERGDCDSGCRSWYDARDSS